MRRQHGSIAAAGLAVCLFAGGSLAGCAGPSTRVLPRAVVSEQPYEIPEEDQVLEEVNPFYLQESLDYLSGFTRENGTPGEGEAAEYILRLLNDYGYETKKQSFSVGNGQDEAGIVGTNIIGIRKAPAPDADILIIAASHDSLPGSPGANNNASGAVTLLECARLLSRLPTDTELRFVSFSGNGMLRSGSRRYVDSLTEAERHRVVGAIQLDTLGAVTESRVVLGTIDGEETLIGDLLGESARAVSGLTSGWNYVLRDEGNHVTFLQGEIPAVLVTQAQEAFENGTPQDRVETVNVELLAGVVDVVSHTVAGIMSTDSPSQLAKAHFMNNQQNGILVQRRDIRFPFGQDYHQVQTRMGAAGELVSSNVDGMGIRVETYQYRMKWFGVDQVILTNYHYSDGKLEIISLDADGAGVEFEEMKDRISSWYGEPFGENDGPNGIEYDWTDPLYHKFIALIPASDGFEVEIRDYTPERKIIGTYRADGTVMEQRGTDARIAALLDLVRDILPAEDRERLSRITVYTDGVEDTTGYLELSEPEAVDPDQGETEVQLPDAELWIDVEDAFAEDGSWRNRTASVRMLTECYGQLLDRYGQDSYSKDYRERFWLAGENGTEAEAAGEMTETALDEKTADDIAAPVFAQDFMRFVLFQKPREIRDISDGRIRFFYDYEELVKIRTWIRSSLQLSDETTTEILPPEGGVVPPGP